MPLPAHVLKAVLLGTARQRPEPSETLPTPPSTSAPDVPREGQLLLAEVQRSLRERAGYVPEICHLPLPDTCTAEETQACSDLALGYLRLLLAGVHAYALTEWLAEAFRLGLHVSTELLPRLLLLGQNQPPLRPYILPLVGQRGLWLAMEIRNQNWKWVFDTPFYPLDDLIEFGRMGEADLLRQLKTKSLAAVSPRADGWYQHRVIWSPQLMQAFLQSWEATKSSAARQFDVRYQANRLTATWLPFAYFFPLNLCEEISLRLGNARFVQDSGGQSEFLHSVQLIFAFRQGMNRSLSGNEV